MGARPRGANPRSSDYAARGTRPAVDCARYNFDHCRVYAPFDARVTNLTLAEGAYAYVGQQLFTLIDTRMWWTIANFRGRSAGAYPSWRSCTRLCHAGPRQELAGVVDSVSFGVTPDPDVICVLAPGCRPPIARSTGCTWLRAIPCVCASSMLRLRILLVGETSVVMSQGGEKWLARHLSRRVAAVRTGPDSGSWCAMSLSLNLAALLRRPTIRSPPRSLLSLCSPFSCRTCLGVYYPLLLMQDTPAASFRPAKAVPISVLCGLLAPACRRLRARLARTADAAHDCA
jgi:hypothetical protein